MSSHGQVDGTLNQLCFCQCGQHYPPQKGFLPFLSQSWSQSRHSMHSGLLLYRWKPCSQIVLLNMQRKTLPHMTRVRQGQCTRSVDITPMRGRTQGRIARNRTGLPGKIFLMVTTERARESNRFRHHQPRASSHINDNYCVTKLQARLLARSPTSRETINTYSNVNFHVVPSFKTGPGHS